MFIFAGQSNMVGSDSRVEDIHRFPPFAGLEEPQDQGVRFSYNIGRENKMQSAGWVDLQPVNGVVGPELSFRQEGLCGGSRRPLPSSSALRVERTWAETGTRTNPVGFEMYPLALELIRTSLAALDEQDVEYRIEGFMWHQGENDMFEEAYMRDYGEHLSQTSSPVCAVTWSRPETAVLHRRALHEDHLGHGPAPAHVRHQPGTDHGRRGPIR